MRILLAVAPVDFRKGIGGLAVVCRQKLRKDPFAGHVFVFHGPLFLCVHSCRACTSKSKPTCISSFPPSKL